MNHAPEAARHDAADWYRRSYPDWSEWVDRVDGRCWQVLVSFRAIHNLVSRMLPDGGIQQCGSGIQWFTSQSLATFDFDELTRLVVAAHEYGCRVQVANDDMVGAWENRYEPTYFATYGPAREFGDYEPGRLLHVPPGLVTSCGYETVDRDGEPVYCRRVLRRVTTGAPWRHDCDRHGGHTPVPEDLEVFPLSGLLTVTVHPRTLDQDAPAFERHPGLTELVQTIVGPT